MLKSRPSKRAAARWLLGSSLALFLGIVAWPRSPVAEHTALHLHELVPSRASAAAPAATVNTLPAATSPASSRSETATAQLHPEPDPETDDGVTPMQPHPADPARAALIPPWAAFEEVEDALAKRDFDGARAQLELRRRQDPNPEEWRDF